MYLDMKLSLILGGPGCGKTTRLLDIVRSELDSGVDPREIAFVAFTKAAADEAKHRAAAAFSLDPEADLPWFRTIHSLAYRHLSLTRDELMNKEDWKEFATYIGEPITGVYDVDAGLMPGVKKGDSLLRIVDYASTTMLPLEDAYRMIGENSDWHELKRFDAAFRRFKSSIGKLDFTDMLLSYADEGKGVPVRVAVVDEAQDLTAAQWSAVRIAFGSVERLYIGGDDDQAIYRWAGADIDAFLSLSASPEVLSLSHRLPRKIFAVGQTISSRISKRYIKPYRPADREGHVDWHHSPSDVDLRGEASWLLLGRNGYILEKLEELAKLQGIPYTTRAGSSINMEEVEAIRLWGNMKSGKVTDLSAGEMRSVYKALDRPRPALKELQRYATDSLPLQLSWYAALVGIPLERRDFYVSVLRAGESLTRPPRVRIETIHGVKGAEADKVMVMLDMSWRTSQAFETDPDNEHRVFYVAVTRAKEELHLISAQTPVSYPI